MHHALDCTSGIPDGADDAGHVIYVRGIPAEDKRGDARGGGDGIDECGGGGRRRPGAGDEGEMAGAAGGEEGGEGAAEAAEAADEEVDAGIGKLEGEGGWG